MRKIALFLIPIFLGLGIIFTIAFFFTRSTGKGALQVTANPKSKIYLNGKYIGTTPLCKCEGPEMLDVGEYTIRIEPQAAGSLPFEEKITVVKSILTVVDRTFGKGLTSEGSIVSLTPLDTKGALQLLVISFPAKAQVYVDGNIVGQSPLLLQKLTESDHEVTVKKDGYKNKIIRIHTVTGYKLSVVAYLGEGDIAKISPTTTPQPTTAVASPSAVPTAQVTILQTPTGFLRVHDTAATDSPETGRVNPGETYTLLDETNGWIKIQLTDGKSGWVSSQYVEKK